MRELTRDDLAALAEIVAKLAATDPAPLSWTRPGDHAGPGTDGASTTSTDPKGGGEGGDDPDGDSPLMLPPGTEIRTMPRYRHLRGVAAATVLAGLVLVAMMGWAAWKTLLWDKATHGPGGSLALAQSVATWLALAGVAAIVGGIVLRLAELSDLHVSVPRDEPAPPPAEADFAGPGDIAGAAGAVAQVVTTVTDAATKLAGALAKTTAAVAAIVVGAVLLLASGWLAAGVTDPPCEARTAVVSVPGERTTSVSVVAVSESCAPTTPPTTAVATTTPAATPTSEATTTTAAVTTTTTVAPPTTLAN